MSFSIRSEYNNNVRTKLQWSLEKGYDTSVPFETEPRRTFGAGPKTGITLVFRAYEQDQNAVCYGPVQGFKVWQCNEEAVHSLLVVNLLRKSLFVISIVENIQVSKISLQAKNVGTKYIPVFQEILKALQMN